MATPEAPTAPAQSDAVTAFNNHRQTIQQARYAADSLRVAQYVVRTSPLTFDYRAEVRDGAELTNIVFPGGNVFDNVALVKRHWQDAGRE